MPGKWEDGYKGSLPSRVDTDQEQIQSNEPQHDKTNKMSVRPAKTQISHYYRNEFWSLGPMKFGFSQASGFGEAVTLDNGQRMTLTCGTYMS